MKQSMIRLALVALTSVFSWGANSQERALPGTLEQRIRELETKVVEWRRDIHEHPELSNREFRTAAKVAKHLRELGIETTTEVAHTGVVGLLVGGQPGPVIALRADMDGLPITERADLPFASKAKSEYNGEEVGVMHACGHDTHVAILMGVAEILAGYRDSLPGVVKFIFQPAEEGPPVGEDGGAPMMIEEGVLENPKVEAAFALHINASLEVGHLSYNPGGTFASVDPFRVLVKGRGTHGAYPWSGADPIVAAAQMIVSLQTIVSRQIELTENAAVVSVGSIHGGNRSNIIPEEVEFVGTLRALDPEDRIKIRDGVRRIVGNIAEAMGVEAEIEIPYGADAPVTYNDPDLTAKMAPALEAVAGAENVAIRKAQTGAEDFAFISERVPSFYYFLGGRPSETPESEAAPHHTPDFFVDEDALILGVRSLTAVALSYLESH